MNALSSDLIKMLQVLVSTAKPCDSPDERLIIHHVSPPPPLPLHLHLRPARDAGKYHQSKGTPVSSNFTLLSCNHPHNFQFFGGQLNFPEGTPTSNFDSIINALLTVFQVTMTKTQRQRQETQKDKDKDRSNALSGEKVSKDYYTFHQ